MALAAAVPARTHALRAAFTLVELLVVVGIMAVVMGIAIGTLGSYQRDNRLHATERLITGLLHQARNTARTSGLPVILRIAPVADSDGRITGGTVSGITQTSLVSESFEDDAKWQNPKNVLPGTTLPKFTLGRTGHGLRIETERDPPTILDWPSLDSLRLDFSANDRSKRLTDTRLRNQGFYLGIAIHMPNILAVGTHHRPLVIVGSHDLPDIDTSVAGLILRTEWRPMQKADNIDPLTPKNVLVNTYEVLGWVGDGHGQKSTICSVDDAIQNGPVLHSTALYDDFMANPALKSYQLRTVDPFANPNPILSPAARTPQVILRTNRWVDVGLLFDGQYLTLFIDQVAVNRRQAVVALPQEAGFNTLWYGAMRLPKALGPDYSHEAIPDAYFLQDGILDDVRLLRLGAGEPVNLPRGVRPWFAAANQAYELIVHPDGRCQQMLVGGNGATAAVAGNLTFADVDDPLFLSDPYATPTRTLTVTVDVVGHVVAQEPALAWPDPTPTPSTLNP